MHGLKIGLLCMALATVFACQSAPVQPPAELPPERPPAMGPAKHTDSEPPPPLPSPPEPARETAPEKAPRQLGPLAAVRPEQSEAPAAARLRARAEGQLAAGELEAAMATAERALRLAPESARVWTLLARIHLRRGELRQAEQFSRKSNLLCAGDFRLQAKNWRIIAAALRARGAKKEADIAQKKAKSLEKR